MKKLTLLVTIAGVVGALSMPSSAMATCNDGDSQARDADGNVTGADRLAGPAGPSGTTVYGDLNDSRDAGYLGVTGSTGYIEVSGDTTSGPQVDGQSSNGAADGRLNSDGVCLNDVSAP